MDAKNEIAPTDIGRRDPDLLDGPGALDLAEHKRFARRNSLRWRNLPATAKPSCVDRAGPVFRHPPFALVASRILGADRAGLRVLKLRQIAEMQTETRESFTHSEMRPCFARLC